MDVIDKISEIIISPFLRNTVLLDFDVTALTKTEFGENPKTSK